MRCEYCGTEFKGKFCHNCGNPASPSTPDGEQITESSSSADPFHYPPPPPSQPIYRANPDGRNSNEFGHFQSSYANSNSWNTPDKACPSADAQRNTGIRILIVALIVIAVLIAGVITLFYFVGSSLNPYQEVLKQSDYFENGNDPDFNEFYNFHHTDPEHSLQIPFTSQNGGTYYYDTELENGNYIAGVDFPAGTYEIMAISGYGYVYSSNPEGINALMSDTEDDNYIASYSGAYLPEGTILTVDGITVYLVSENASSDPLFPRQNTATETVDLSPGVYTAGVDFSAGIYNVVALEGQGFVSSNSPEGGIGTYIGFPSDDFFHGEYKNVVLKEGTELELVDVSIQLVPST